MREAGQSTHSNSKHLAQLSGGTALKIDNTALVLGIWNVLVLANSLKVMYMMQMRELPSGRPPLYVPDVAVMLLGRRNMPLLPSTKARGSPGLKRWRHIKGC